MPTIQLSDHFADYIDLVSHMAKSVELIKIKIHGLYTNIHKDKFNTAELDYQRPYLHVAQSGVNRNKQPQEYLLNT